MWCMGRLPGSVTKYFWGDRLDDLDWEKHKEYITKTILEMGDEESVKWLIGRVDRDYLKRIVNEKRMDPKSKNFWNIYL